MSWSKQKRLLGAVIVTGTVVSACGAKEGGDRPRAPESVGAYLDRTLPSGLSGTFMAVSGGRVVHCEGRGFADKATRTPATCDTVYDIMSITKQFTAAAILKLEMMGRLRTGDRIGDLLGPVPADKRRITLHHLLTHTSGLAEGLGDDYDPISRDAMLTRALASKLRSAPGKRFHYSNVGYSVLAAIIEKASGMPYERFLARHLYAPAGMKDTGYVLPRWKPRRLATEYDENGTSQGKPNSHPWAPDGPYWYLRGNGGMLTTAPDMFRWHLALSGDRVLSAAAKRKLFGRHVRVPGSDESYGYGWAITDRFIWHDGGNSWSLAVFARTPHATVFWVSNHAYQRGRWNLEDKAEELTEGMASRAAQVRVR